MDRRSARRAAKVLGCGLTLAMVVACGGGGSGAPGFQVSGDAVKGPMAQALIRLYQTTADGQKGELLAQTRSDANGHYTLDVPGYSGIVLAEASVLADTTLADEASGTRITPVPSFMLRASFLAGDGQPRQIEINPYTELATATALAQAGALSPDNVAQAQRDVQRVLGFDPMTATPTFSPNLAPGNTAALALAALSQMAAAGDLNCSTGTQAERVGCITTALSQAGLDDGTVQAALQTRLDALATGPLQRLQLQTAAAEQATLAQTSAQALALALLGAEYWQAVVREARLPFTNSQNYTLGSAPFGSCRLYSDESTLAASRASARLVACGSAVQQLPSVDALGERAPCTQPGTLCQTQWSQRVRLSPDATRSDQFTVYTQLRAAGYTLLADQLNLAEATVTGSDGTVRYPDRVYYGAGFPGEAATLTVARDGRQVLQRAELSGLLAPSVHITRRSPYYAAGLQRTVYPERQARVLDDRRQVHLTATRIGNGTRLQLDGDVAREQGGSATTRLTLAPGSLLQWQDTGLGALQVRY